MIIVYPNNIVVLSGCANYLTEKLVYLVICLPETFIMRNILGKVVEKGPEGLVAKTVIVFFDMILREKNRIAIKLGDQFCFNILSFFLICFIPANPRPPYPYAII